MMMMMTMIMMMVMMTTMIMMITMIDDDNDESCWNSRGWGDNANKCDALNKSSAHRLVMMMTIMTIRITNQILVKKFIKQPDNEKKNEFLLNGDINELPKFDKIFHLHNFLLH